MDVPGRRVLEDDPIEPNVLAADEADHHRTEIILHLIPTFLGGDAERHVHASAFFVSLHGSLRREPIVRILESTATRSNLLPLSRSHLGFLQWSPIFAVSIDGTLTGDCYILQVATGDRRLATACVQALERGLYEWVEIDVGREEDDATFLYMEVDVALQRDRSGEPNALWHDELAATFLRQGIDGLAEGIGTEGGTIAHGTEVLQVDLVVRELRASHLLHLEGKILVKSIIIAGFIGESAERHQASANEKE